MLVSAMPEFDTDPSPLSANRISVAARLAAHWHAEQRRNHNHTPFVRHLSRVASRTMLHADSTEDMVCAAWLHDILEDQAGTPERETAICDAIASALGQPVLALVKDLTNPSLRTQHSRTSRALLDRDHLESCGPEVKLIKLIDRIDNLEETINDLRIAAADNYRFSVLYAEESLLLAQALRGTDRLLETELVTTSLLLVEVCQSLWTSIKKPLA